MLVMRTIQGWAAAFALMIGWSACNRANGSFKAVDLGSGEDIVVIKDEKTGKMVNKDTGEPVELYVERSSRDTIYGPTGEVVNNKLRISQEGRYVYYGKIKDGDFKYKADDGEYKVKDGDYKEKYEDGEYKVKDGDYKKKVEADGDVKIKNGDRTIKIDGETGEVKVKD